MSSLRFLIATAADGTIGTLMRCLALAAAAQERGHQVLLFACEEFRPWLANRGIQTVFFPAPPGLQTMLCEEAEIVSVDDFAEIMGWLDSAYVDTIQHLEDDLILGFSPDWLISDFALTAGLAAQRHGIQHAAVATWPLDPANPANRIRTRDWSVSLGFGLERLRLLEGLAPLCFATSNVAIVPSIPMLEQVRSHRSILYSGHLLHFSDSGREQDVSIWEEKSDYRVFLYLSASDIDYFRFIEALIEASEVARARVLVAWGTTELAAPGPVGRLSEFVETRAFVPDSQALPRADAVICHGGQNSVIAALYHRCPVAGIPLESAERRWNIEQVTRAGAGFILERSDLAPTGLTKAICRLRKDQKLVDGARRLSSLIRRRGGPNGVIQNLERISRLEGSYHGEEFSER